MSVCNCYAFWLISPLETRAVKVTSVHRVVHHPRLTRDLTTVHVWCIYCRCYTRVWCMLRNSLYETSWAYSTVHYAVVHTPFIITLRSHTAAWLSTLGSWPEGGQTHTTGPFCSPCDHLSWEWCAYIYVWQTQLRCEGRRSTTTCQVAAFSVPKAETRT